MARQIAQFLWVGPKLSAMEQMCLRSFAAVGYEVHLYVYNRVEGVPQGVRVLDASEILPADQAFGLSPDCVGEARVALSNRFRLHLLFTKGGWWFDLDFAALQLKPELPTCYLPPNGMGLNIQRPARSGVDREIHESDG